MIIVDKPADPSNYLRWRLATIDMIVIHVEQGYNTGAAATFQQRGHAASAHYGIGKGGSIWRFVNEEDTAWHAGNRDYNGRSIGIELEGFVETLAVTDAQMESLVDLVTDICRRRDIPMDRQHLVGHDEIPNPLRPGQFGGAGGHKDPGPRWNWDLFMQKLAVVPAAPTSVAPI